MAGPSLGEITSIRGDANIGAGTAPGANLSVLGTANNLLANLDSAATLKAAANKYALEEYQKNIAGFYKDFNEIDVSGLMEKDYPLIRSQYAKLATDIANNYDVVANPWKDQQRYADLKGREATLRSQIAESKQHVALRTKSQEFIRTNKDFETPQNIAAIKQFSEGALGERDPGLLLSPAPRFNVNQEGIAKQANAAAMEKLTTEVAKNPFLTKTERTRVMEEEYNNAVKTLLGGQDLYGRNMLNGAVADAWRGASPTIQQQYTGDDGAPDLEAFAQEQLYGPLRLQDQSSTTLRANPFSEIAARGAEQRRSMRFGADLADRDMDAAVDELAVAQLEAFSRPDVPGVERQTITTQEVSNKKPGYYDYDKLFLYQKPGDVKTKKLEGVDLPLSPWAVNTYSIPGPKVKSYDEETGKETTQDSFIRPQQAWVTTEKDPNARRVIVRYKDPESGEERDLAYPYAENLRLLNNVYGEKNAFKLGNNKIKVFKRKYGQVAPDFETLNNDPEYRNPDRGGALQPQFAPTPGQRLPTPQDRAMELGEAGYPREPTAAEQQRLPASVPDNSTVGGFDFNATRRRGKK